MINYIVVDIETIAPQKGAMYHYHMDDYTPPKTVGGKLITPEKLEEKLEEHRSKMALNALYGEIIAIGYATPEYGPECLVNAHGELDLLKRFAKVLEAFTWTPTWVGFNLEFDTTFIRQRMRIHGIDHPFIPWRRHERFYDIMEKWNGSPYFVKGVSLESMCIAFGIGEKHGSYQEAQEAWRQKDYGRLREYNDRDVIMTQKLFHAVSGGVKDGDL